ncbi:TECPR2 [Branchiostoma lanceolatum]|uniref:TECPR2 protein n=1 Tax=Branchiostoma lanceolatum TaxID=7740 RepID=A0A8J9ZKM1_BRALA|nr:TECPR2 [Branchiostoma lanceolatum]
MRTMGWALLLLLATFACTAAEEFDFEGEEQLFDREDALDEELTETLEDIEELKEDLRRGFSGGGHGHGRGGGLFSGGGHGHGHSGGSFSGGGHGHGGGGLFGHGGFLGTGLGAGHGHGGSVQSAAHGGIGTTNLALNRPAAQSSEQAGGAPERAVDGDDNPDWVGKSCTHTRGENNPWWRVDLGTSQSVGRVVVTNRKDCCSERLENFKVYVGDNPEVTANPTCGGPQSVVGKDVITVNCGGLTGRYVGIALSGVMRFLTLCEVKVFGGSAGGGGFSSGGLGGGGGGGGAAAWLHRDPSWVVDSAGTPWKIGAVTYDAAKVLDGNTDTYWNPTRLSKNYNNWWIVLDFKRPYTLSQIAISHWGDTTHDVKVFKLQKSASGKPYRWEDVKSFGNVQAGTNKRQEFGGFKGTARYWRFVVTQTNSGFQPYLKALDFYGWPAGGGFSGGGFGGSGGQQWSVAGKTWAAVGGTLKFVSIGASGVWGVTAAGLVKYRTGSYGTALGTGSGWETVEGNLVQISVGNGVVWGVNSADQIWIRTGISSASPKGTGWKQLTGGLRVVSCGGKSNYVWGVNYLNEVWMRTGIQTGNLGGTGWQKMDGVLKSISVGQAGVWGVKLDNTVVYRTGTYGNPGSAGRGWKALETRYIKQVSVGMGVVWAVSLNSKIWLLQGITDGNPAGSGWKQIPGSLSAVCVSSGSNQVWGVGSGDQVFRRSGIGGGAGGGGFGAGGVGGGGTTNIALNRPAAQSSTAYGGAAGRAVDGNDNPMWAGKSCTHTTGENNPWWRVDLGTSRSVGRVVVTNRKDCCSERLEGFTVYVGDSPELLSNPTCGGPQSVRGKGVITVNCGGLTGRYVGIALSGAGRMLTLCEVKVFGGSAGGGGGFSSGGLGGGGGGAVGTTNIALNRPAAQSSTAYGGAAGRAVDGNDNPMWAGKSCTHTTGENNPWWRVDLGTSRSVGRVVVTNRKDCCSERLEGFTVYVGDSPELLSNPSCGVPQSVVGKGVITVNCGGLTGRYVGIALSGAGRMLTLCEVKVFGGSAGGGGGFSSGGLGGGGGGAAVGTTNIALNRPAAQSSTAYGGAAGRAVDGNDNAMWAGKSCTHTTGENNPWWRVDLGTSRSVGRVVVTNRKDCCSERLEGFTVYVGDSPELLSNPTCGGPQSVRGKGVITVNCGGLTGRYVGIALSGAGRTLTLCEVKVFGGSAGGGGGFSSGGLGAGGGGAGTTNIALNRPAAQSSTAYGGAAGRAVDGNDNPMWAGKSCTHTTGENNPWWRVDLGSSRSVGRVVVTNRKDCCSERLEGFTVYVGDSPELLSNPSCGGPQSVVGKGVITVNCGGLTGRYVGIALSGAGRMLTLCEVKVFGGSAGGGGGFSSGGLGGGGGAVGTTNIALNRPAAQSSTAYGGAAGRAVDGNDSPMWAGKSCTHTTGENNPWWRVDLGTSRSVGRVVVTNRKDCCSERLEGFTVYVGDSPELLSNPSCGVPQSVVGKGVITVNCGGLTGRYVGIALSGAGRMLTLCEVKVFGGKTWDAVGGALRLVSIGASGVWGVTAAGLVKYRTGSYGNALGTGSGWETVNAGRSLVQVSVGNGVVWGVNAENQIWLRTGISSANPKGIGWQQIPGSMRVVSCGGKSNAVWGVNNRNEVFRRRGITPGNLAGTSWKKIAGVLKSISVGQAGVWGLKSDNSLRYRTGTYGNPGSAGRGWKVLTRQSVKQLTVGIGVIWAVSPDSKVWILQVPPVTRSGESAPGTRSSGGAASEEEASEEEPLREEEALEEEALEEQAPEEEPLEEEEASEEDLLVEEASEKEAINLSTIPGAWLTWSLPSGSITSAGTTGANDGPAAVLNGDPNTYWNPQGLPRYHNNWWIIFDLQKTYTISSFKIQNFGDTTHDVTDFKLETSDDKSTWTQVFSTGSVRAGVKTPQPFGGFYGSGRYWRFTVTKTTSGWQPYLVRLTFYGVAGKPNNKALTIPTSGVTSAGTPGPQYGPRNVLDGNPNTYWNPQGLSMNYNNWWIIFDFQRVYTLSAIQITNFGDTAHDVTAFKLETSDDKVTWKRVYSTTGVRPGVKQPQMFGGFSGTGRYWRFTATRTASGNQPYLVGLMFYIIIRREPEKVAPTHFKVVGMLKTVAEAKEYCKTQEKGHLADIKSSGLLNFLMTTIKDIGPTKNYWVGLHDTTMKGGWQWADGTPLSTCSYQNWAPGEPSNIGEHACAQLWAAKGFQLDSDDCNEKKFFICQAVREVEADPGNAFEAMRSSLLREEEELSDRTADKYRRSEADADFHNLVRLADVKKALESEIEFGPTAMEKLNEISRELSECWKEVHPNADDVMADDIPREMSVMWEEQEADDVIAREVGDTPQDASETEEELGSEVDEDAFFEDIEGILEELKEIEDEQDID